MVSLLVFVLLGASPFISADSSPSSGFNCSDIYEYDFGIYNVEPIKDLSPVYEILINCPETKSLRLKYPGYYGETLGLDPLNFKFLSGDRFPPLRELSLSGYDFGDFRLLREQPKWDHAHTAMKPMAVDIADANLPRSQTVYIPGANLDVWQDAMDWTALHELKLSNIDNIFFYKMKGKLPALTDLAVHSNQGRSNVSDYMTDFLIALNSLSNFSAYGLTGSVNWSQVIERHGSTLERLEIQEWNAQKIEDDRHLFSLAQIEEINHRCPRLSELSVNINTGTGISNELLDTLASFGNLTKLTIRLRGNQLAQDAELEEGFTDELLDDIDPLNYGTESELNFISAQTVLKAFHYIRLRKQGTELKQLIAYVGNHEINYGAIRINQNWAIDRSSTTSKHVCSVFNDDGARKAEGEAWCQCEGTCKDKYPWY